MNLSLCVHVEGWATICCTTLESVVEVWAQIFTERSRGLSMPSPLRAGIIVRSLVTNLNSHSGCLRNSARIRNLLLNFNLAALLAVPAILCSLRQRQLTLLLIPMYVTLASRLRESVNGRSSGIDVHAKLILTTTRTINRLSRLWLLFCDLHKEAMFTKMAHKEERSALRRLPSPSQNPVSLVYVRGFLTMVYPLICLSAEPQLTMQSRMASCIMLPFFPLSFGGSSWIQRPPRWMLCSAVQKN